MPNPVLRAATSAIIAKVEQLSGCAVLLVHDPSLKTLATVSPATTQQPVHRIRFKTDDAQVDYQIAFECGFLLRQLALPPAERVRLGSAATGRDRVVAEVGRQSPALPADAAGRVGAMLYDGLMTQLRSCGPGIRVDLWLHADYPELRDLQADSLEQQAREYAATLDPAHDRQFPATVVRASRAMNAAHALFTADLLDRPHLAVPWQAAGFERIGRSLLAIVQEPAAAGSDRAIVDGWARQLGLEGWYEWVPADEPSGGSSA
jgi:hypothetical protein